MSNVRHKVFIAYHKADGDDVEEFIRTFDEERDVFITRSMVSVDMDNDIINSDDTDYVMRRIGELYLKDSTVTIVMIGKCTWARKYIDWEIQASIHNTPNRTRNGLMGVLIPSLSKAVVPNRLKINLPEDDNDGYARFYAYPKRKDTLTNWIDDAFQARTGRTHLIQNPVERFSNNRSCS